MIINIAFNTKSINTAIKQIRNVQKKIPKMVQAYLQRCCEWIQQEANKNLEISGIGSNVIAEIEKDWQPIIATDKYALLRNSGRGYMVEFGIGIVGENNPHPNANSANYQYNIDTRYKHADGKWRFNIDSAKNVDIKQGYFYIDERENKNIVITKGMPATMFVYQAAMNFKSTNVYKEKWEEIKKEYIG